MSSKRFEVDPVVVLAGLALGFLATTLLQPRRQTVPRRMQINRAPAPRNIVRAQIAGGSQIDSSASQQVESPDGDDRDWAVMYSIRGADFTFGGARPHQPPASPRLTYGEAASAATRWELKSGAIDGKAQLVNVSTGQVVEAF